MSVKDLADKMGWLPHHIERLENGQRDPLQIEVRTANKLCGILGKTLDELFGAPKLKEKS